MEQWEIDLRAKLELQISPGSYCIGDGNITAYTGKGGYINYLVELTRAGIKWKFEEEPKAGVGITEQVQSHGSYRMLTKDEFQVAIDKWAKELRTTYGDHE